MTIGRAAVAFAGGKPQIVEVDVAPPGGRGYAGAHCGQRRVSHRRLHAVG